MACEGKFNVISLVIAVFKRCSFNNARMYALWNLGFFSLTICFTSLMQDRTEKEGEAETRNINLHSSLDR
jgi:hypothetical protein